MTWLQQWHILAARIDGLLHAAEFLVSAFKVYSSDVFGVVGKSILPELAAINTEIEELGKVYACELPAEATQALYQYIAQDWGKTQLDAKADIQTVAALAAFRSRFEYLIRDSESEGRNMTELAFEHLRRCLVVDENVKAKWQKAFKKHETACEKLGAIHLLSHGIWAFKVVAPGGATDLVFSDPLQHHAQIVRKTARALILTEWKLVKSHAEIVTKAQEARDQATIYSGGILGDIEVKRTRYVVLVCQKDETPPDDILLGMITYRHIVLAVNPEVPSLSARNRKGCKNPK
jgi:16S rRNA G966 N2-methylase RsmD